jgi:dihydrofolate reductase
MRKLILWNLVTLDGYFDGPKPWDLEWHSAAWGDELEQFSLAQLQSADLLLFGRVTYEGMYSYWSTAPTDTGSPAADTITLFMNSVPKVVFSHNLKQAEWHNTRLVKDNAAEVVAQLKQTPGKDILLFGSANLAVTLSQAGLIDEYRLCLTPITLGGGQPLFKPGAAPLKLKLLETRALKTGAVLLFYRPER